MWGARGPSPISSHARPPRVQLTGSTDTLGGQVGQQASWTEQQAQHGQQLEQEQHAQDSSAGIPCRGAGAIHQACESGLPLYREGAPGEAVAPDLLALDEGGVRAMPDPVGRTVPAHHAPTSMGWSE